MLPNAYVQTLFIFFLILKNIQDPSAHYFQRFQKQQQQQQQPNKQYHTQKKNLNFWYLVEN